MRTSTNIIGMFISFIYEKKSERKEWNNTRRIRREKKAKL